MIHNNKYQNITNETKLFLNNSIHRREDAVINSIATSFIIKTPETAAFGTVIAK